MHEGRVLKHVVIVKDEVKQNITEFCLLKERPGYTVLNGFFFLNFNPSLFIIIEFVVQYIDIYQ